MKVIVSQIAAMAANSRVIGKDNQLLWHVPKDLQHFKNTTMGKPVIMGRKTFDSVGFALPGRTNIVVTRQSDLSIPNVTVVGSCDEAIDEGIRCCEAQGQTELMVVGGEEIYAQTMPRTDRIYLSVIDIDVQGDAIFPEFEQEDWQLSSTKHFSGAESTPNFDLKIYDRA